jgi:hypothetical protein
MLPDSKGQKNGVMSGFFLCLLLAACLPGSAQQSEVRQVGSFKAIKSAGGIDVYLKKGDKESVRVEASGVRLQQVVTEVAGTTLRIDMRSGSYRNWSVAVHVTYVRLEKLSASSASSIFSDEQIEAVDFEVNASSAANIELKLAVGALSADVSSAGEITLEGRAKTFQADASSAGSIDAYRLEADVVHVTASSAGDIKITAVKEIEASASSAGSIRYRGNPSRAHTSSSSGGSVKKTN